MAWGLVVTAPEGEPSHPAEVVAALAGQGVAPVFSQPAGAAADPAAVAAAASGDVLVVVPDAVLLGDGAVRQLLDEAGRREVDVLRALVEDSGEGLVTVDVIGPALASQVVAGTPATDLVPPTGAASVWWVDASFYDISVPEHLRPLTAEPVGGPPPPNAGHGPGLLGFVRRLVRYAKRRVVAFLERHGWP